MKPTNKCRYFSKLLPKPRRTDMDWDHYGFFLDKCYVDKKNRPYKFIITWLERDYASLDFRHNKVYINNLNAKQRHAVKQSKQYLKIFTEVTDDLCNTCVRHNNYILKGVCNADFKQ